MNRYHALSRLHHALRAGRLVFLLLLLCAGACAQDESVPGESTPDESTLETPSERIELSVEEPALPATTPATSAAPREFGRTIVLVLGGVSWSDWLALASQSSTATPGMRRVLEEGALGAAFLPAANRRASGGRGDAQSTPVSGAMLRASLLLSSGQSTLLARGVADEASFTLGLRETLGAAAPSYEEGEAALLFARRTDRAPLPGNLVNLGWGALQQNAARVHGESTLALGALAAAFHRAGGKTAALGAGDTTIELAQSTPLREWAIVACDENGVVDGGDLSNRLLARDPAAPFGLRANRKAYGQALDTVFAGDQTGLVAIEWGDTRRAKEYEKLCAPDVAAAHRQAALRSADAFVQSLIGSASTPTARLDAPRDRLVIIGVPELHARKAQWLPVVYWRPGRGGQGALLEKTRGGEGAGAIGLENLHARLVLPLGVEAGSNAPTLTESGAPQNATVRVWRLMAFQSGLSWLERARNFSHALWCAFFISACGLTLWALHHRQSTRSAKWARAAWCAAMVFPWLLWLAGLCVAVTWRFGTNEMNWQLSLALLLVACVMWFLIGATFNWFGRAKLQRIRIALIWLALSAIGLKLGNFVLPWNTLLHLAPADASTPAARIGEVWGLLLISATLFGISGLTKAKIIAPKSRTSETSPETSPTGDLKRVVNLRPALIWIVVLLAMLWARSWGSDGVVAGIALLASLAMWLRMWLEKSEREVRLRHRRIVFIAVAIGVLLLWQRGGASAWPELFALWRENWAQSWRAPWWDAALLALCALVWAFAFTGAREALRTFLAPRYSLRALLGASALASLAGLLIYGPAAPVLLSTFTLGAIAHEILGSSNTS